MGRDVEAVVNPLQVYGVEGLRLPMPRLCRCHYGNTNAACIMIGEKAADLAASEVQ